MHFYIIAAKRSTCEGEKMELESMAFEPQR